MFFQIRHNKTAIINGFGVLFGIHFSFGTTIVYVQAKQ